MYKTHCLIPRPPYYILYSTPQKSEGTRENAPTQPWSHPIKFRDGWDRGSHRDNPQDQYTLVNHCNQQLLLTDGIPLPQKY